VNFLTLAGTGDTPRSDAHQPLNSVKEDCPGRARALEVCLSGTPTYGCELFGPSIPEEESNA